MNLEPTEKIHLIERRAFETDLRRHFVGEVIDADSLTARVRGFAFVYDSNRDAYVRARDRRVRIVSLIDSRALIRILPREVDVEKVVYRFTDRLVATDGKTFELDINEFNVAR